MILLSYACQLSTQTGVSWLVLDSETSTLCTYTGGGHCRDLDTPLVHPHPLRGLFVLHIGRQYYDDSVPLGHRA